MQIKNSGTEQRSKVSLLAFFRKRDVEGAVPYNIGIKFAQIINNRTEQRSKVSLLAFFRQRDVDGAVPYRFVRSREIKSRPTGGSFAFRSVAGEIDKNPRRIASAGCADTAQRSGRAGRWVWRWGAEPRARF